MSIEPAIYGNDLFGEPITRPTDNTLGKRFLYPPFSVWNAREGWWQERKAAWISLGIKSEIGRQTQDNPDGGRAFGEDLMRGENKNFRQSQSSLRYGVNEHLTEKQQRALGCYSAFGETCVGRAGGSPTGASIFDPVVCELCYRWFCPIGGRVVDPFAGGSVRGIVAVRLGLQYYGIELRSEQVAANTEQAAAICGDSRPEWVVGDVASLLSDAPAADFIFSCPPYGNLEVYSDDPRDLSAMSWPDFCAAYRTIIGLSAARLRQNRFACYVVGDFRDDVGAYRNFVGLTVDAFAAAGLVLYNEAILITAVGSLPIRINGQFNVARKLGKTHQNVLVFYKGDPRRIKDHHTALADE